MSCHPTTYYNEHDGRFQVHWMDGPYTEVRISEDMTLFVQGSVQGIIVGIEIPQPKVISELCKEIAGNEKMLEHCQRLRNNTFKLLEEIRGEEKRSGDEALEETPLRAIKLIKKLRGIADTAGAM